MPINNVSSSDLDKLKKELSQKIDKVEKAAGDAQKGAAAGASGADVTRRIDALEKRVQKIVDDLNKTLQHAKQNDDRLEARIAAVEKASRR